MAFGDFGCLFGQGSDLGELPGGWADTDEGGDRQPERGGTDVRPVAGDNTGSLQALDALGDGRGRHAHAAGERGHRDPGSLSSSRSSRRLTESSSMDGSVKATAAFLFQSEG